MRDAPYRGAQPYQFKDGDLFFGRDAAAREVIETIHASPVTVLHARSGAGKTSLLNTRVLPGLEANGLTPVVLRLWDDPVASVRQEIPRQLFPKPAREADRFDLARRTLGLPGSTGLVDLLDRFDEFREEDPNLVDELLRPSDDGEARIPFAARLLNSTLEPERYLELANFVTAGALWAPGSLPGDHRQIPVDDLTRRLRSERAGAAHAELLRETSEAGHNLVEQVSYVFETCHGALRDFELALVFDQFEEIFTRFRSDTTLADGTRSRSWEAREELFDQLAGLCDKAFALHEDAVGSTRLQLQMRLVFSLREEFFSRMNRLRDFVPEQFIASYRLELMSPDEARSAIVEPADAYGTHYESSCLDRLVDELTVEDRFVEPSQLSIVCDLLWNRVTEGRRGGPASEDGETATITLDDLEAAGSVPGLLEAIVTEMLEDFDPRERLEALDLVQSLQSDEQIRQILPERSLVERAFRTEIRQRVLSELQERYFVRLQAYRGATLVEITHEALLRAFARVLGRAREDHPEFFTMWRLLDRLEDLERETGRTGRWRLLDQRQDLIDLNDIFHHVEWHRHPGACELVLRSWLVQTTAGDREIHRAVRWWGGQYRNAVASSAAEDPLESFLRHPSGWRLERCEDVERDWPETERHRMLRALIQSDTTPRAELVGRWTRRITS